jgi:pimeloyl-ACP methyl ester carboxylesterase
MQTSQIQVDNLAITVYDSQGSGPAAFFIHGNSANAQTFQGQLEGPLGQEFRVVALDLPGHGTSDRAANPGDTYHLPGYARAVAGVVQQLGLAEAVLVGWSLGGHIALEAVKLLPQSRGILIWGTPPVGIPPALDRAFLPNPAMAAAFQNDLSQQQVADFGAACLKPGSTPDADFFAAFKQTDGLARSTMGASIMTANFEDELKIVANLTKPLAILQGEHEQLVSLDYLNSLEAPTLWRGAVQVIPDAGHSPHLEQPEAFNSLVAAFLRDTNRQ